MVTKICMSCHKRRMKANGLCGRCNKRNFKSSILWPRLILARDIREFTGLPLHTSKKVVDTIFNTIKIALQNGEVVKVENFGRFDFSLFKATNSRNPRHNYRIDLPDRTLLRFWPSPALKRMVNETYLGDD